jgi:hypothetical protein
MVPPGVVFQTQDVNTNTCVSCVGKVDMERRPVESESRDEKLGLKPKYLRQNLWSLEIDSKKTAAEWTELAEPLPWPSPCEYKNLPACQSLSERPISFRSFHRLGSKCLNSC